MSPGTHMRKLYLDLRYNSHRLKDLNISFSFLPNSISIQINIYSLPAMYLAINKPLYMYYLFKT